MFGLDITGVENEADQNSFETSVIGQETATGVVDDDEKKGSEPIKRDIFVLARNIAFGAKRRRQFTRASSII
ncbi:MAG: hypothetical protein ACKVQJ_05205 [Pyrinomonadaceae bacterium]